MRTKTLFLAAAALAAGLATSVAQSNVYSVNIVGYINVSLTGGAKYLLSNPFDTGNNVLTNLGALWTNGTLVQTWNGSGFDSAQKSALGWSANPSIKPGTGFFVSHSTKAQTLTFVGSAPVTNNYVMVNKVNQLVGAVIPISGSNTDIGGNTLNLGSLNNGTIVQTWTGSGWSAAQKSILGWSATNAIPVAAGFFLYPGGSASATWKQWLQ